MVSRQTLVAGRSTFTATYPVGKEYPEILANSRTGFGEACHLIAGTEVRGDAKLDIG